MRRWPTSSAPRRGKCRLIGRLFCRTTISPTSTPICNRSSRRRIGKRFHCSRTTDVRQRLNDSGPAAFAGPFLLLRTLGPKLRAADVSRRPAMIYTHGVGSKQNLARRIIRRPPPSERVEPPRSHSLLQHRCDDEQGQTMARKDPRSDDTRLNVNRRKFLAGVAVTGAAATAVTTGGNAAPPAAAAKIPSVLRPTARQIAAEAGVTTEVKPMAGRAGSDFMVDVIKSLDIDYCYANPASSYRGIHESLINYGQNTKPEFITCMHEESSVAMAHGNFKVTGKPQMVLCHGTVGLMHATMAIYNAWADRVPVIVVGGNDLDAAHRPPGVPTYHSGQDINALVRDITKWDDNPVSLQHFAQSFVRAYKMSMMPPYEPVMIALDGGLQEEPIGEHAGSLYIPKYVRTAPPHADTAALRETAKMLVNAENPVIVVDRMARSQNGINLLVELAELIQAPVVDQSNRMNFPNTHHLCQSTQAQ